MSAAVLDAAVPGDDFADVLHGLVDSLGAGGISIVEGVPELLEVGNERLHRLLGRLVGAGQQLTQLTAAVGREWDSRRLWANDGSRSAGHRLARDTNQPVGTAKQLLRAGRAAAVMPHVQAAWAAGTLSLAHLSLFSAARSHREVSFERDEAWLVTQACELRFDQFRKVVAYWQLRADAELGVDGPEPVTCASASFATTFQGVGHLDATFDPIDAATFGASLAKIEQELYRQDLRDGTIRTVHQRNAAVLVEMAHRAHAMPADGRKPDPLMMIAVGPKAMEWLCELSNGVVIHPGVLVPHLSAVDVQSAVYDDARRAVGVSPQRTFTGWLRRVIQVRDLHCQHPSGCDTPMSDCDVDHILPRREHGITEQTNGRLLCRPHNRNSDLRTTQPPFEPPDDDEPPGYSLADNAEPDPGS